MATAGYVWLLKKNVDEATYVLGIFTTEEKAEAAREDAARECPYAWEDENIVVKRVELNAVKPNDSVGW